MRACAGRVPKLRRGVKTRDLCGLFAEVVSAYWKVRSCRKADIEKLTDTHYANPTTHGMSQRDILPKR